MLIYVLQSYYGVTYVQNLVYLDFVLCLKNFILKISGPLAQVFSCEFCEIPENTTFFTTLLKTKLWHMCFPVNFAKFLRTPFLQNTSGRLLLLLKVPDFLVFKLTVPGKRRNADSTQRKYSLARVSDKCLALPKLTYSFYLILRMLRALCPTLYLEMYVSRPRCLLVINTTTEICLFPCNLFRGELNVLRENIKKD